MKVFIYSHIADPDGVMPIVLSKLVFKQLDFKLVQTGELSTHLLENKNLNDYDLIFITDLCPNEEVINKLSDEVKQKLLVFDHHLSSIGMNKFPFITVKIEENGIKQSGTSLYYQYLLENFNNQFLSKDVTKTLVEMVRSYDTWTWKDKEPKWLVDYFDMFGYNHFIDHFYKYIQENDSFLFDEKEIYLFESLDKKTDNYLLDKEKEIISVILDGKTVGIVFAENNRSILGNFLADKYKDRYECIIIINVSRSISYRSISDRDVNIIAEKYNGGGHKNAAGSPVPNYLREYIIKQIFKDAILEECNEENNC